MKSKEEIKKWLLKNCIDEDGTLCLRGLDFSDFDNDIYIDGWTVKANLYQNRHIVGGSLDQSEQEVKGDLFQGYQEVDGDLEQSDQEFGGTLFDHNTKYLKMLDDRGWCITYKGNKQ